MSNEPKYYFLREEHAGHEKYIHLANVPAQIIARGKSAVLLQYTDLRGYERSTVFSIKMFERYFAPMTLSDLDNWYKARTRREENDFNARLRNIAKEYSDMKKELACTSTRNVV